MYFKRLLIRNAKAAKLKRKWDQFVDDYQLRHYARAIAEDPDNIPECWPDQWDDPPQSRQRL